MRVQFAQCNWNVVWIHFSSAQPQWPKVNRFWINVHCTETNGMDSPKSIVRTTTRIRQRQHFWLSDFEMRNALLVDNFSGKLWFISKIMDNVEKRDKPVRCSFKVFILFLLGNNFCWLFLLKYWSFLLGLSITCIIRTHV